MKEFKTYAEQIYILKERGLTIKDEQRAKEILKKENYYFLINAYKSYFTKNIEGNEQFKKGTLFNEIYTLYSFDKKLRNMILKIILPLENTLKSISAYHIAEKINTSVQYEKIDYFYDIENIFDTRERNYTNIEKENSETKILLGKRRNHLLSLINKIEKKIKKYEKRNSQIKHYLNGYKYVPIWVLFPVLELGFFAEIIETLKIEIKYEISMELNLGENTKTLDRVITIITFFRNISAHNVRTFDFKVNRASLLEKDYYGFNNYDDGKSRLFALIIIFKKLLNEEDFNDFFNTFKNELIKLEKEINSEYLKEIKKAMGLPNNWEDIINK